MSDAAAALPFDIADRYAVTAEIGRGGFAVVYRARDRMLERDVAIKILRADSLPASALRRFSLELQITARLEHPNILHVYDTGTWDGRPYFVMEYVRGETLETRLSKEGVLAVDDALGIATNVGDALAFAHASGVVHRDVKPANILLRSGGALLGDFGIAYVLGESTLPAITSTGFAVGTMQYMSPEQLCAEPRIDARSDQYSLALVCYEMFTGVQPFVASTVEALRALRMVGSFAPASTHRPALAVHVDVALARALAPAPADRFRDVREFVQALLGVGTAERTALASGNPVSTRAATSVGLGGRTDEDGRAKRRSHIRVGVIAVLLIALVGLGSESYLARRDASAQVADAGMPTVGVLAPRSAADSVFAGQVHDELNEWRDVSVLPSLQDDRRSLDAMGVQGSRALAARLHSTLLLDPVTSSAGDSSRFTLAVFDGRSGRLEHIARLRPRGRTLDGEGLRAVVLRALVGAGADSAHGIEQLHEPVIGAARAYVDGWRLMRAGSFDSAMVAFASSATQAPSFAEANLWSAQMGAWLSPKDPSLWRAAAVRADARATVLSRADSLQASALVKMASGDPPAACFAYRKAVHEDPESFVAWFGLGQCQEVDSVVVRDPRLRGGVRFRSSHWSALAAYREALRLLRFPGMSRLFVRATRITYASGNVVRLGVAVAPDTQHFMSVPSLAGDSIETVPLASALVTTMARGTLPESYSQAVARGRRILLDFTEIWVSKAPLSAEALVERAYAQELTGSFEGDGALTSAARTLERAALLAPDVELRSRIDAAKVRVAVRRGSFDEAARIANAILSDRSTLTPRSAAMRAPLAAFVGNIGTLSDLLRLAASSSDDKQRRRLPPWVSNDLTPWLADSLRSFGVRATLGHCAGLAASRSALDAAFREYVAAADLAERRLLLLRGIYRTAVPCIGVEAMREFRTQIPLDEAFAALDAHQPERAKAIINDLDAQRRGVSASNVTPDALLAEAWVWMQTGDSVRARSRLQAYLTNIASVGAFTFNEVSQAAALSRIRQSLLH